MAIFLGPPYLIFCKYLAFLIDPVLTAFRQQVLWWLSPFLLDHTLSLLSRLLLTIRLDCYVPEPLTESHLTLCSVQSTLFLRDTYSFLLFLLSPQFLYENSFIELQLRLSDCIIWALSLFGRYLMGSLTSNSNKTWQEKSTFPCTVPHS